MQDLYLSFADEAIAHGILFDSEQPLFRNIDVIGVIYKSTGEMLQGEDGPYPEMAPVPGWHVNVRLADDEDGADLQAHAVAPVTPVRVWA